MRWNTSSLLAHEPDRYAEPVTYGIWWATQEIRKRTDMPENLLAAHIKQLQAARPWEHVVYATEWLGILSAFGIGWWLTDNAWIGVACSIGASFVGLILVLPLMIVRAFKGQAMPGTKRGDSGWQYDA